MKGLIVKSLDCGNCGKQFQFSGVGRSPKYCSEDCKRSARRKKRRESYTSVSVRDALLREVEQGYWSPDPWMAPEAPTAHLGMSVGEAVVDESGLDWTVSRADAGLRSKDRGRGSREADSDARFPLEKSWADKGADLDIEIIRRKDRSRFGGPVGAWSFGPTPREPGWIPAEEWLGSLPDDGKGWVNGLGVNPQFLF